jgi:cytochrome P450
MRLQAPVPLFFRNASKNRPVILGGKKLPANTQIFITNWLLHRDPKHWTDPERYVPDRWLNGGVTRDPLGSGFFFPFGRGPRTCVGQEFAMFYMKLALAVMLTRRKLVLDQQQAYQTEYFFAVQHPKNLKARFLFA